MKYETTYLLFVTFILVSWVVNITKFASCDFDPIGKAEILHAVGVFVPPVALVTAWVPLGK